MKQGFALVITLSLMILLVIVAVGLLGLASISLRTSGQGQAQAQAQANARLALQMAIGDLQKALGPDQRISARASVINGTNGESNLVGAWESWHWNPMGSSTSPDYGEKKQPSKFKGWLVSNGKPEDSAMIDFATASPKDPVWLVNPPGNGAPPPAEGEPIPQLRASMVTVRNSSNLPGGIAWGVMDESIKAPIHLPEGVASTLATTNEIAWRTAPPRAHPELVVPQLAPVKDKVLPERFITLPTAVVASGAKSTEILGRQDDLTVCSLGLQTDVVNGGFKKDLTTAFETTGVNLTTLFGNAMTYGSTTEGGPRWEYLRSHYQLYKKANSSLAKSGVPKVAYTAGVKELQPKSIGIDRSPTTERLLPVIAKLQIMFSIVTHPSHITDRVNFFNSKGNPPGNHLYGCPHLVYDPVVTLYNPYDVAIEVPKLRVRIWDPPVLFGFKKNNAWLRDEFASPSGYQGLARFQIRYERDASARRSFTLLLTEKNGTTSTAVPGRLIRLEPGEVKVFSPWIEDKWNWKMETGGGDYSPRAFFDWRAESDFGNRDNRTGNTYGIEAVPGWDAKAGLQTDHLSYQNRPQATRYDFEIANNWNGGWLGIKAGNPQLKQPNDTFSAYAKPGRTITDATTPDFKVDVLAASVQAPENDILRSYSFRFTDVEGELTGKSPAKIIERTFTAFDLMQLPTDMSPGGKTPFGILTMSAKTTNDPKDVSMPWLHNHPVTEGNEINTNTVGTALDSYDLRFEEVQDFNVFPGIEIDKTNRGFYGASATANRGVSNVPMFRVPLVPANSLGDLIPANLASSSALPRVTHPLGGSRAHPLIPGNAVTRKSPVAGAGRMLDHTYLLNDVMWDQTFFSTVATFSGGLAPTGDRKSLLSAFLAGEQSLLNPRLVPFVSNQDSAAKQAETLDKLAPIDFARQIGASLAVAGAFNINSDSVVAWRSLLASMRDESVRGWKNYSHDSDKKTSFPRASLPLGGDGGAVTSSSIDIQGQKRWAGYRALDDGQIEDLAKAIVAEIRRRGAEDQAPSLSLAEFINRRIGSASGLHTMSGLLEEALKTSGVNTKLLADDSNTVSGSETLHPAALKGLAEAKARLGMTAEGAPSVLTQGDLLMPLAGVITPRGDTFRIRAYGEARDAAGRTVIARAKCEAVVQRIPDFVDPADQAAALYVDVKSPANLNFGRRFVVTSFRWLDADEI